MKKTQNREKILQFLSRGGAYNAHTLHKEVGGMDLATIYRTLNLFVKEGLVKELFLNKGESLYEIVGDDHQHAMCNQCGKVIHIPIDKSKLSEALQLEDFEVESIELVIRGHCKDNENE